MKKFSFFILSFLIIFCSNSIFASGNSKYAQPSTRNGVTKVHLDQRKTFIKVIGEIKILAEEIGDFYHLQICNIPGHSNQNPPATTLNKAVISPELAAALEPYLTATQAFKKLAEEYEQ